MKHETRWRGVIVLASVGALLGAASACSSDESTVNGGTGGGGGSGGGSGGAAGKGSGGTAGTGGKGGSGGLGGTGGQGGTGGKGGTGGLPDAGPDAAAAACVAPKVLVYEAPGCNGASKPLCAAPALDAACAIEVCGCDGTTLSGCGDYTKPYRHKGACTDSGVPDAGKDAH